jgi:hypothetical protein
MIATRLAQSLGITCTAIGACCARGAAQPASATAATSAKTIRTLILHHTFDMFGTTPVVSFGSLYPIAKRQVSIKQFAVSSLSGLFNYKRNWFHDVTKKYRLCMYYTQNGIFGQILDFTWRA